MKCGLRFTLLLPMAALIGCTLPSTTPPVSTDPAPTGDWTNWQIQAGTAITSPPNTYPAFLGAIQTQGTQASGIFTTIAAAGTGTALDYSGTFNSSTDDVTLATYGFGLGYTQPTVPYTLVPVGVIGGCVYPPGYTGVECLALIAYPPSVGVEIAPLTGTYVGTLTGSATPTMSGTATLTLTQSSTPNASGQFPLTATLAFVPVSGSGTDPLTGTVSGEGISLSFYSTAVVGPAITLTASTNPAGTQITVSSLANDDPGMNINATFTGTLTRQ